jgi:hypothetical protein
MKRDDIYHGIDDHEEYLETLDECDANRRKLIKEKADCGVNWKWGSEAYIWLNEDTITSLPALWYKMRSYRNECSTYVT